jgi:hypothetical protein
VLPDSNRSPNAPSETVTIDVAQLVALHRQTSIAVAERAVPHTAPARDGRHGGPRRPRRMRGALAAAALTAAVLTSATMAVDSADEGDPVFPGLSSLPLPRDPEPPAPAEPTPPAPAPPEPTGPTGPAEPAKPEPPRVAVGRNVVFVADYETGDFSQWGTCQSALVNGSCDGVGGDRAMKIVPADVPGGGRFAALFTVRNGDVPEFGGGERSEVSENEAGAETREGDERWYEWSMRLPEDFRTPRGGWFIVMQWHAGSGSPPLAIDLSKGTVDIGGDGTDAPRRTIGPLRRGEWVDYVLHVKFSRSDSGFVEAWENGKQTVPRLHRPTMSSSENYLKQGIYRDDAGDGTAQVEFGGLRVTAP